MFAAICSAGAHVVAEYYNKLQYDKTDGTMEKQQQQQQQRSQTKFDHPEPKEAEGAASFVDSLISIVLTALQRQWLCVHVEQGGRGLQERVG